jgi:predicted regulator of Ras-like GTPase activity (Roadblock/LC7/MglB family)
VIHYESACHKGTISAMAIKGSLGDISLRSIITLCCYEKKQSCLRITHNGREASLFFKDGEIVHIALDSQEGAELIDELLTWEEGAFEIEQEVTSPKQTVATNWNGLLLAGMRHIDGGISQRPHSEDENRVVQPIRALSSEFFEQIGDLLCNLLGAVGGRCAVITDRGGRLIHWQGKIDRDQAISLAALISGSFSATAEIAEALHNEGETCHFKQSLQEGEDFSMFSVPVGERSILSLCFNSNDTVPLGLVRVRTLKAATAIQEVLAKDAAKETGIHLVKDLHHNVVDALDDLLGD